MFYWNIDTSYITFHVSVLIDIRHHVCWTMSECTCWYVHQYSKRNISATTYRINLVFFLIVSLSCCVSTFAVATSALIDISVYRLPSLSWMSDNVGMYISIQKVISPQLLIGSISFFSWLFHYHIVYQPSQ